MKAWRKLILVVAAVAGTTGAMAASNEALACLAVSPTYGVAVPSLASLVDEAEHLGAADARPLVEQVLERDGFALLAKGWTLARVMVSAGAPEAVATALARAVSGDDRALAQRAAVILKVIGVAKPEALASVLAQPDMDARGREALRAVLADMPGSGRRAELLSLVDEAATGGVSAR